MNEKMVESAHIVEAECLSMYLGGYHNFSFPPIASSHSLPYRSP